MVTATPSHRGMRIRGWAEFLSEATLDLVLAARKGDATGAQDALRRGAAVNAQDHDNNGNTPLHHAVLRHSLELLCVLLNHPKVLLLPNVNHCTAIHLASQYADHPMFLLLLLRCFGSPCLADADSRGNTSLHLIAYNHSMDPTTIGETVRGVLQQSRGVTSLLRAKNAKLQTPLDVAVAEGHRTAPLQQVMLSFGARQAAMWDYADQSELHVQESKRRAQIVSDEERMWRTLQGDVAWSARQWGEWMNVRREQLRRVEMNLQTILQLESQLRRDVAVQEHNDHKAMYWLFLKEYAEGMQMARVRQQDLCATTIQRRWRGVLARRWALDARRQMLEYQRRCLVLTRTAQRLFRGHRARGYVAALHRQHAREIAAAIRIQRVARDYRRRRAEERAMREAEAARAELIRMWMGNVDLEINKAAVVLQRFASGAPVRHRYLRLRSSAGLVQAWWRDRLLRRDNRELWLKKRSLAIVVRTLQKITFRFALRHQIRVRRHHRMLQYLQKRADIVARVLKDKPLVPRCHVDFKIPRYTPPKKKRHRKDVPMWLFIYECLIHAFLLAATIFVVVADWSADDIYFDVIGVGLVSANLVMMVAMGRRSPLHLVSRLWDVLCIILGCLSIGGIIAPGASSLYAVRLPMLLEPNLKITYITRNIVSRVSLPIATLFCAAYLAVTRDESRTLADHGLRTMRNVYPHWAPGDSSGTSVLFWLAAIAVEFAWLGVVISTAHHFTSLIEHTTRNVQVRAMQSRLENIDQKLLHDIIDWEGAYVVGSSRVHPTDFVTPPTVAGLNLLHTHNMAETWSRVLSSFAVAVPDPDRTTLRLGMLKAVAVDAVIAVDIILSQLHSRDKYDTTNLVFVGIYGVEIISSVVFMARRRSLFRPAFVVGVTVARIGALLLFLDPSLVPLRGFRVLEVYLFNLSSRTTLMIRTTLASVLLLAIGLWLGMFYLHSADLPMDGMFDRADNGVVIMLQLTVKLAFAPICAALASLTLVRLSFHTLLLQAFVRTSGDELWMTLHKARTAVSYHFRSWKERLVSCAAVEPCAHTSLLSPRSNSSTTTTNHNNNNINNNHSLGHGNGLLDEDEVADRVECVPTKYEREAEPMVVVPNAGAADMATATLLHMSRACCFVCCAVLPLDAPYYGSSSSAYPDVTWIYVVYLVHLLLMGTEYIVLIYRRRYWYCTRCFGVECVLLGLLAAGAHPATSWLRPVVFVRLLTSFCYGRYFAFLDVCHVCIATLLTGSMLGVIAAFAVCLICVALASGESNVVLRWIAQPHFITLVCSGAVASRAISFGEQHLTREALLWKVRMEHIFSEHSLELRLTTPLMWSCHFVHILSVALHLILDDVQSTSLERTIRDGCISLVMILLVLINAWKHPHCRRGILTAMCVMTDIFVAAAVVAGYFDVVGENLAVYAVALRCVRLVYLCSQQVLVISHVITSIGVIVTVVLTVSLVRDRPFPEQLSLVLDLEGTAASDITTCAILRCLFALLLAHWVRGIEHVAEASVEVAPVTERVCLPWYLLRHHVLQLHDAGYPNVPHPIYCREQFDVVERLVAYVEHERCKLLGKPEASPLRLYHTSSLVMVLHILWEGFPVLCPQQSIHWQEVMADYTRNYAATLIQSHYRRRLVLRHYTHATTPNYQLHRELHRRCVQHKKALLRRFLEFDAAEYAMMCTLVPLLDATTFRNVRQLPSEMPVVECATPVGSPQLSDPSTSAFVGLTERALATRGSIMAVPPSSSLTVASAMSSRVRSGRDGQLVFHASRGRHSVVNAQHSLDRVGDEDEIFGGGRRLERDDDDGASFHSAQSE
eukprot:PhM_4_TR2473/c0_g1_i1/m.71847